MSEPELDIDQLMARIRAEVARRHGTSALTPAAPAPESPTLSLDLPRVQLLLEQAQRIAQIGTTVPPYRVLRRVWRPLARVVTRLLFAVLRPITVDQRVFNGLLHNALSIVSRDLQRSTAALLARDQRVDRLAALVADGAAHLRQLDEALVARDQRIDQLAALAAAGAAHLRQLDEAVAELRDSTGASNKLVASLRHNLTLADHRVTRLLEAATQRLPQPLDEEQLRVFASEYDHRLDMLYVALEERFRGSREDIKTRQRIYLAYIQAAQTETAAARVVDLGCGRGEWLELLKEQGISGCGVDLNRIFLEQCRDRGFEAIESDAVDFLRGLPDGSVGAVTAFQLVEHLSHNRTLELFAEAARVLQPRGVLVVETPNPGNVMVGSCDFYLDPTHRHPLPSPLLQFLVEAHGFCEREVLFLHPRSNGSGLQDTALPEPFAQYFCAAQDYAIVARRP